MALSQEVIDKRIAEINEEINKKNEEAGKLLDYLNLRRKVARELEEKEEEELKMRGIIIGQHVPSLKSKLHLEPTTISEFPTFSSSLLVAKDLIDQNKTNFLRRTGNLPISDAAYTKQIQNSKTKSEYIPDAPHYLMKTNNTETRESKVAVRFSETLESYKLERTDKNLTTAALVSAKKKTKRSTAKLSAEQRLENENILKSINHKLNYLRNPRNDPRCVTKMLVKPESSFAAALDQNPMAIPEGSSVSSYRNGESVDPPTVDISSESNTTPSGVALKSKKSYKKKFLLVDNPLFICEPSEAHFTNYNVGEKYSQTLTFRNVSAVSRSLRVLQPENGVFSITPLRFPANCNGGMIAPGIAVSTTLKFCPQSLGDYSDVVRVETESGSCAVTIVAQREPPQLSIPSTLDIGACFVGDANRVVFQCSNTGGAGKFLMQNSNKNYNDSLAQSNEACLRIAPFTIYPTEFTLYRNDSVDISIEFIPLSIGSFEQHFDVVCDNGQVRNFCIKGKSKEIAVKVVEVNSIELDTSDPKVFSDLYFSNIDIGGERTQHLQIVNDSGLPVEYEWVWMDSSTKDLHKAGQQKIISRQSADEERLNRDIQAIDTEDDNGEDFAKKSLVNTMNGTDSFSNSVAEDGFSLSPARGVLPSDGIERFSVTYSPLLVSTKISRAVLVIKSVPFAALPGPDQRSYLNTLTRRGHGKFYRLRSWLEEIGSAGEVDQYELPNGTWSNTKQLLNLRTIISLLLKQTSGKYGEVINDFFLAQEYARINNWIRKFIRHVFQIRRNSAIVDDMASSDEEGDHSVNLENENAREVVVNLLDCVDLSSKVPTPLYPITVTYSDCKVLAGSTANDMRKLFDTFSELDATLLVETWVDVHNALSILGDNICKLLDNQVAHEAVEYLKECALTNLSCLNFRVFGEGKPRVVTINPPVLDIGGHLSIGREWTGSFQLINTGDVMTEIKIDTDNITIVSELSSRQLGEYSDSLQINPEDEVIKDFKVSFNNERVLLMAKGSERIDISCNIQRLGKYDILIPFRSELETVRIDTLRLSVNTTVPRLRFNVAEMDLGLIGVGGEGVQMLSFTNEGDVPVFFMVKPSLFVDIAAAPRKQSETKGSARKDSHRDSHKELLSHRDSHKEIHSHRDSIHKDSGGNLSSRSKLSTGRSDDFSVQDSTASSNGDFKIELKYAVVVIDPPSGVVKPQETFTVKVKCSAGKTPQRIRGMLECRLFSEDSRFELLSHYLNLRGEVQAPKTIMYPMKVNVGTVYVGQPVKFTVTIENLCNLPTKYKLLRPGGESSLYKISFDKGKGDLQAKEKINVECTFTALLTGFIDDVLSNKIFGSTIPLGFEVKALAKGVLLEFMNLGDNDLPPQPLAKPTDTQFPDGKKPPDPKPIEPLVVGSNVPLYERRVRRFVIRNFSAVPAKFELRPKKYTVAEKVKRFGDRSVSSLPSNASFAAIERSDLLIAAHEGGVNNFNSEAGKKYIGATDQRQEDRKFLYSGLGASYLLDITDGVVPPWGVQVFTLRAFNDIPGTYDDDLECVLHEGEVQRVFSLPVRMDVTGCPVIIEKDVVGMTEIRKGHDVSADMVGKQIISMGHVCVNSSALVREFYLKNNGSKKGRVTWNVRSVTSKANGPIKFSINVNTIGQKVKSSILFWEDLVNDSPFTIEPAKATIKPYGRQKFTVTLTKTDSMGREISKLTAGVSFSENGLSSPSIEDQSLTTARTDPSALTARAGTSSAKFSLELFVEGEFLHPTITIGDHSLVAKSLDTINYVPETEALILESQAPLLFGRDVTHKPSDICLKPITILNPHQAPLQFSVSIEGPYCLKEPVIVDNTAKVRFADAQPGSPQRSKPTMEKSFRLFPNESGSLVLGFNPSKSMRESLMESFTREAGQSFEQKGAMVVTYSTGQIMHLPIITRIGTPFLVGSSPRVYFGVCHVTKPCEGIILLSNPTDVPANWTVAHVPGGGAWKKSTAIRVKGFNEKAAELDDPSVFEISPEAGVLKGPTVSVSAAVAAPPKDFNRKSDSIVQQRLVQSSWATNTLTLKDSLKLRHNESSTREAGACYPVPLTVRFLPKQNSAYSCRFRFTCEFGNEFDVVFQGEGTYEEHLHNPVVPTPK